MKGKIPARVFWRLSLAGVVVLLTACQAQVSVPDKPGVSATPSLEGRVDEGSESTPPGLPATEDYQIITLLPKDAIPAIDDPIFYSIREADREYEADELVLGVALSGEYRAYSTNLLDRHEIVNDTVGGRKISVTW